MDVTADQLKQGMMRAHEAGDVNAAKLFATKLNDLINTQKATSLIQQETAALEMAGENLPSDVLRLGKQAIDYASSPVETTKKLVSATGDILSAGKTLGQGIFAKAYPNISERIMSPETIQRGTQTAEAVGSGIKEYFTSPEARVEAKQKIAERPATTMLDVAFGTKGFGGLLNVFDKTSDLGKTLTKAGETIDPTSVISKPMQQKVISKTNDLQKLQNQNIFIDDITKQGVASGYKLTPQDASNPSWWKKAQQLAVGDGLTRKIISDNQEVTNKLARKYLNVPQGTPLGENILKNVKTKHKPTYDKINEIQPIAYTVRGKDVAGTPTEKTLRTRSGSEILQDLDAARGTSKQQWNLYVRKPEKANAKQKALAADAMIKKYEDELLDLAQRAGEPDLVDKLRKARVDYAKAYTVDKALNPASGDVNAQVFASLYNSGAPITDEGKIIAQFATQHKPITRVPISESNTYMNKFDAIIISQNLARKNLIPAGVPLLKYPIGANLAREGVTKSLAFPSYKPSLLSRFLGKPELVTPSVAIPSLLERREEEMVR